MIPKPSLPVVTSAVVALSLVGSILYFIAGRKKRYTRVARVKKLYFHPVKSLKGIEVKELNFKPLGVEYNGILERTFMLVTDEGILVSQRQEPSLVLLITSFAADDKLRISGSTGDEDLLIPLKHKRTPEDKIIICNVNKDLIEGIDCGDEAAQWFQRYLNRDDVRLVRHSVEVCKRKYGGNDPSNAKMAADHPAAFQDCSPLHLLSESSISDLNSKMEENVSVLNFRPNVLVEECSPYAEDEWKYLKFSSGAEAVNTIPCGRCILTTVNPTTGIKTDKEPLVTLRKYRMPKDKQLLRRIGYSPCFGMLFGFVKEGSIHVGDDVYAIVEKNLYEYVAK